jgi:hypothetical protein
LAQGRFVLFDSARGPHPPLSTGQIAVDVDSFRRYFKSDPFVMLLDEAAHRVGWQIGPFRPSEVIARVDKGLVRRRLLGKLRGQIEEFGGIWLRVSPYPFPYQSAFNFRIDYDEYNSRDFQTTRSAISGHEHATSHYVCGANYEKAGHALEYLRGLDVGTHGYRHHVYRTVCENVNNVQRGIEVLRQAKIEPSGFAGPHGRFNRALLAALEECDVTHSSEFGLAYDDLPFFPGNDDVVQIPVHPISLGILLEGVQSTPCHKSSERQPTAADVAIHHFREFARSQHSVGEPAFLYGHPTRRLGRFPQVLEHVFQEAESLTTMWHTTLTNFAAWWRARSLVNLTVTRQAGCLAVTALQKPQEYGLGIEYIRGQHVAALPLQGRTVRFRPDSLGYRKLNTRTESFPPRVDRTERLREHVKRMVDWERVTPIDEIQPINLRNLAKRTLRRLAG